MLSGTGAGMMVNVYDWLPVSAVPLVAAAVIVNVPAWLGEPLTTPFAFSVNPAGNVPDASRNVNGPDGPLAASCCLYVAATWPSAIFSGVNTTGGTTVSVNVWLPGVPMPLVATMVMVNVPVLVGSPLRTPLLESVTLLGNVLEVENVGAGKPLAVTWKLSISSSTKRIEFTLVIA